MSDEYQYDKDPWAHLSPGSLIHIIRYGDAYYPNFEPSFFEDKDILVLEFDRIHNRVKALVCEKVYELDYEQMRSFEVLRLGGK